MRYCYMAKGSDLLELEVYVLDIVFWKSSKFLEDSVAFVYGPFSQ